MAHLGTLRNYRFSEDASDIRGSSVYGLNDEKLGKIDDVIFDHASGDIRYAVIDTGGWLSTKKFVVPGNRLRASSQHEGDFQVDLDKKQVEAFPAYNESDIESSERWGDYEGRYRSKWADGPIMHREATDRNITPTTAQMTQGSGATGPMKNVQQTAGETLTPQQSAEINTHIVPTATHSHQVADASGISQRWSTFEEKLRERRKEIISSCVDCGSQPSGVEQRRKVS